MEKEKEQNLIINFNSKEQIEKPVEVVLRKGEAPRPVDPLAQKEPLKCDLKGTLHCIAEWLTKRKDVIKTISSFILVDRENLCMKLIVNERDFYNKQVITAESCLSKVFKELHINDDYGWTAEKLSYYIRLNRSIFVDKQEAIKLVTQLRKLEINVKSQTINEKSSNGSLTDNFSQVVSSSLPEYFEISIPLITGGVKKHIKVELEVFVENRECLIQLISSEANELINEYKDKSIDQEIKDIKEIVPEMVIIEGKMSDNSDL